MAPRGKIQRQACASPAELQNRLTELEQTLEAIRNGQIDALVDYHGNVFTLQGADTAYRIMVDTMSEGALTIDADGFILYANASLCAILGIPLSAITGRSILDFVDSRSTESMRVFLDQCILGQSMHGDFVLLTASRTPVPVYLSGTSIDLSGRAAVCMVASDLSDRVAAERKLLELNTALERKVAERTAELQVLNANLEHLVAERTKQVHDLSKALTIAEQKERLRFSQVLHDDLQQILFSAKIQLDILKTELPALTSQVVDDINRLIDLIDRGIHASKSLALELNPPVLRTEGLDAALQWLGKHMEDRYALKVSVELPPETARIRETDRILIVQIARELLFNVVKHAKSAGVRISGGIHDGHIEVTIEDEGVGFDVEEVRGRDFHRFGMGLFSIQERLHLFGGRLHIESQPGQGTSATIHMPLSE